MARGSNSDRTTCSTFHPATTHTLWETNRWSRSIGQGSESMDGLQSTTARPTSGDALRRAFGALIEPAMRIAVRSRSAAQGRGGSAWIGVHVGEVELSPPNGAKGIAIHEVARIAAAAGSGEILTSEATRALSMSAGLEFTDRGEHQLKGLDGQRRLFAFVADR